MATRIPAVEKMSDEDLCAHLELRHKEDISMDLVPEEEGKPRWLNARIVWDVYHARLHATKSNHDHEHVEA